MANSRIARFITEVAPPQYICVMRHRASKTLDTISEEDRSVSPCDSLSTSPKTPSSAAVAAATGAASVIAVNSNSKYFLQELKERIVLLQNLLSCIRQ